ncbi:hypothetical protein [Phytoactinopolyspora halophila]|nr:hypothetical protein [Phytoactinopolyspora halophila]
MKRFAAVAAATALALPLTACGDDSDYCATVSDAAERVREIDEEGVPEPELFGEVADLYEDVADSAPDDIRDDWQSATQAVRYMANEDMPQEEIAEVFNDAQESFENITENAREECGIEINN